MSKYAPNNINAFEIWSRLGHAPAFLFRAGLLFIFYQDECNRVNFILLLLKVKKDWEIVVKSNTSFVL